MNKNFAVVDLETTGLFPYGHDKILEVAIISLDEKGNIIDEYCTLVNPKRDVSMTRVHGITTKDVKHAPVFGEIAGDIISLLSGRVFVAHNARFDIRFLDAEFKRIGHSLPEFPFLCTMQLAKKAAPFVPSRKLTELCNYFGINLPQAHCAYEDAKATASLLTKYFEILPEKRGIEIIGPPAEKCHWPVLHSTKKVCTRKQASARLASEPSYIEQLISRLPVDACSPPEIEDYLLVLDRVLEDRRVSPEESEALYILAHDCGISRDQAVCAHHSYMRDLIRIALEDYVITESEANDLETVRTLLSISQYDYNNILKEVKAEHSEGEIKKSDCIIKTLDVRGKSVCFTGELNCCLNGEVISRSLAERISAEKGMIVKGNVAKKLDFLVASDPDSISGKAKKAHEYGIRIIAEPVFWQMLGIQVE